MNPKPPDLVVPDDLAERDQWVLWRRETVAGRETKVPYSVRGHRASSTNPIDWTEFTKVVAVWHRHPNQYAGLGFVFSADDPFVGIDLDDCLDANGSPKPWAQGIVERFSDTYIEVSPSGLGLTIWAKGNLPANVAGARVGDGQIEMYDRSRYFTVTGRVFRSGPLDVKPWCGSAGALREAYGRKAETLAPSASRRRSNPIRSTTQHFGLYCGHP